MLFFFSFRDRNPAAGDAHRGPAIPDVITFQCERRFGVIEGAQMKPPCNKIEKKGKVCFGVVRYDGHIEGGCQNKNPTLA